MKSIYCCGPHGNVGWVERWTVDQSHPETVVGVELTLNHMAAYRFGRTDDDMRDLARVLDYGRAYGVTLGSPELFSWEEA